MKQAPRLDLIKARKGAGISQAAIGKAAGVTQVRVSYFERGGGRGRQG